MDKYIVMEALEAIKVGDYDRIPLMDFRNPSHQFETTIHNMVDKEGYMLEWLGNHKGGCWHIVRKV